MNTRQILEAVVALAAERPNDANISEIAAAARSELAIDRTIFVTTYNGRIKDVASDSPDVTCYVIDEDLTDDEGVPATLDTEDGGSYTANVKKMGVTAPHFDKQQVMDAAEGNAYANGSRI